LGERTAALQELRIPPRAGLEVDVPKRFLEGEEARIRATVRNVTTERLTDVVVDPSRSRRGDPDPSTVRGVGAA
jgi:hypothetical protein